LILEGEALLLIDGKPGPTHIFRPATKGARIPVLHRQAVAWCCRSRWQRAENARDLCSGQDPAARLARAI